MSNFELAKETVDSFRHYGVKGMKWGVVREVGSNGLVKKKVAVKDLSDSELNDILNRANLEQRYAALNAPKKSKWRTEVETIVANTAKQQASTLANKYAAKGIELAINAATKKK